MRVGVIAPPWSPIPPSAYGGTEDMIDRLVRGLAEQGHDVALFTTGDSSVPVERHWVLAEASWEQIGVATVEARHVLSAYDALADCDVIHDHTSLGAVLAPRLPPFPIVITQHGPFDEAARSRLATAADRVAVVAISHHHAGTAGPVPIKRVVHHGIDTREVPFTARPGNYLAFLGRMTPDKGVREAALIAHTVGLPLLIAGKMREPIEYRYFHDAVEPLIRGGVDYVGEVDRAQKRALVGGALALLNPLQWAEPFGLVMIEALACGTPVLALARGSAPEIIVDRVTGFVCQDEDELIRKVPLVDSLSRAICRRSVEERFSATRMVNAYVGLYLDLLGAGSASATTTSRTVSGPCVA